MKIQSPPGMRDFYPEDMRLQRWLFENWQAVSREFGFEEYEGPIFEYLDLYTLKSGEGIVSELFNFEDRGGRRFAIRPEMTPTLARMVAARANALPRPIKWFCIPRMCRAEKPQRGRLREFFQWNIDILGVDDVLADAETIAVAVEFLRRVGLTSDEVVVRLSSRHVAAQMLASLGIAPESLERAFQLLDRFERLDPDAFGKLWDEAFGSIVAAADVQGMLEQADHQSSLDIARKAGDDGRAAVEQFEELWDRLEALGVRGFCQFDLKVVRGLAYYTGPVFEVAAKGVGLRALAGGGRYDNLTQLLDGPQVTGVGFGMGDAPMLELLRELGKLPAPSDHLDVFVIDSGEDLFPKALEIVGVLRRRGFRADFSYKRQNIKKQFKQAATRNAAFIVIVGDELRDRGELSVKDSATGNQQTVGLETFLDDPGRWLTRCD